MIHFFLNIPFLFHLGRLRRLKIVEELVFEASQGGKGLLFSRDRMRGQNVQSISCKFSKTVGFAQGKFLARSLCFKSTP